MEFYLEAYDESGQFVDNLHTEEVRVLENGSIRPLSALEREEHGVQVIIAFNTTPPMARRLGNATLFDLTRQALLDWMKQVPANTMDDLSLATNNGFQIIHSKQPGEWMQALQNYQPDLALSTPSLNSLAPGALTLQQNPLQTPSRSECCFTSLHPSHPPIRLHCPIWQRAPASSVCRSTSG